MDGFYALNPVIQALLAGTFTWLVTAAGAVPVFFTKRFNQKFLDGMLGMAAGVMMAASYWSLLAPAIEMSEAMRETTGVPGWVPAVVGFLAGAIALRGIDAILPHLHPNFSDQPDMAEGLPSTWRRSILLVTAITLHNIPEGLAVGVAFGAAAFEIQAGAAPAGALAGAVALAIGIGLQNFPEGMAVAMPLRREGLSRTKCFWYGQLSAIVEPVAAVLGAALVLAMQPILPYALAFAAGAMIFVVAEDLIPEAHHHGNVDIATMGVIGGFTVMMWLDVMLG